MSESPIASIPLLALPEGWEAVGVIAMIKCIDAEGEQTWAFRTSQDLGDEETLGALIARADLQRQYVLESYQEPTELAEP